MKPLRLNTLLCIMLIAAMFLMTSCTHEKPEIGGSGEFALEKPDGVDIIPPYHSPVAKWRAVHMDKIKSGAVSMESCLVCHSNPDKFCNRCHEYVGVDKVMEGAKVRNALSLKIDDGLAADDMHEPLDKWRTNHDKAIIYGKASISDCLGCHTDPDEFCNKCHVPNGIRKIDASQVGAKQGAPATAPAETGAAPAAGSEAGSPAEESGAKE